PTRSWDAALVAPVIFLHVPSRRLLHENPGVAPPRTCRGGFPLACTIDPVPRRVKNADYTAMERFLIASSPTPHGQSAKLHHRQTWRYAAGHVLGPFERYKSPQMRPQTSGSTTSSRPSHQEQPTKFPTNKMKLNPFLAPLLLALTTAVTASPTPEAAAVADDSAIKGKIAALLGARDVATEGFSDLEKRASVTGTVNADAVRYRRCAHTSCEAVGQYNKGKVITITCRVQGDSVNGWAWWDKMSNGYYISDYYVSWTGGVPSVC
ncbi:hypothetical protein DFP72DRAFT_78758, partial [Ephemerocybe angulata]